MSLEENLLLEKTRLAAEADAQAAIEKSAKESAEKETQDALAKAAENKTPEEHAGAEQTNIEKENIEKEGTEKEVVGKEAKEIEEKEIEEKEKTGAKTSERASLFLEFLDFSGKPIVGLSYRIVVGKATYNGTTNDKGHATFISELVANQELEIFVKKDNGQFASKFKGFTACNDMSICAVSPHIKIELETELHSGEIGTAPTSKEKPEPIKAPAIPGAGQINSGGKQTKPKLETGRDDAGNPQAELKNKTSDWMSRHFIPTFLIWSWDDFKRKIAWTTPAIKMDKSKINPGSDNNVSAISTTSAPANGKESAALKVGSLDQAAPKEVADLIKIMEEQATWQWSVMLKGSTSAKIATGLTDKSYEPITGKAKTTPAYRCYPSVKIGLLRARLVSGINGDIPAKGAGPWLLAQGFKDITKSLPDGRWAMPGDVIVYRYTDVIEAANRKKIEAALKIYEKQKADYLERKTEYKKELDIWTAGASQRKNDEIEAKKNKKKYQSPKAPKLGAEPAQPDDENYGHIDVRSYDGYMSDFVADRLGKSERYVVTGIYRKIFDPLPDLRVRAFLKVLREWECHGIPDEKRYYRLQNSLNGSLYFSNTSTHPYSDLTSKNGSFSGAYQIHYNTWSDQVKKFGMPVDFSPATQDRMAVTLIEGRHALGYIRKGQIREALLDTKLHNEWSSLPGGSDVRNDIREKKKYFFTVDDVIHRYNEFLNEMKY